MWVGSGYGDWVGPWALWCLLQVYYSVVTVFQISSVPGYLLQGWCVHGSFSRCALLCGSMLFRIQLSGGVTLLCMCGGRFWPDSSFLVLLQVFIAV
jgi:hypothetical protein